MLPDGKQVSVLCVEGPYACPEEESLGLLGAEELLRVFGDPTNEEPESRKLWAPDGFDPLGFDIIDTTAASNDFEQWTHSDSESVRRLPRTRSPRWAAAAWSAERRRLE